MTEYYYQIKVKDEGDYTCSTWAWPPILSGKLKAENKKDAKLLIDLEYGKKFPQRVLKKNLKNHKYLLHIREIQDGDSKTKSLFELKKCEYCGGGFRIIDKYNDIHERNKGPKFCTDRCGNKHYQENRTDRDFDTGYYGAEQPTIYRIFNIKSGKSYIGKTTQVFTLRWYQHFFQSGSNKFHIAIKESKLEDWTFSIIESVIVPENEDKDEFISNREGFWINKLNTVEGGYNTQPVQSTL